jgi:hypothetical protein
MWIDGSLGAWLRRFAIVITGILLCIFLFVIATTLFTGSRRASWEVYHTHHTNDRVVVDADIPIRSYVVVDDLLVALVHTNSDQGVCLVLDWRDSLSRCAA